MFFPLQALLAAERAVRARCEEAGAREAALGGAERAAEGAREALAAREWDVNARAAALERDVRVVIPPFFFRARAQSRAPKLT